jgi:hypothetical protein
MVFVMSWVSKSAKNLLPLSREKQDFQKALKEWVYTGDMYDLETPTEDCELCEHPDIRYQFRIINQLTENELLVGSECINKFEIPAIDNRGRILSTEKSKKKVQRDRQYLITNAKKKKVINVLVALLTKEQNFNINSFISYVQERGSFTPNQLSFLFWRLDQQRIEYLASDFKLTIRKDREKEQLLKMEYWKMKKLWKAMSTSQRQWYDNNRN